MRIFWQNRGFASLGAMTIIVIGALSSTALAEGTGQSSKYLTAVGASTFRVYCANCHGQGGLGDGQVAAYLKVEPTDLTQLQKSHEGEFPAQAVYRSIDGREEVKLHGNREMPIWGDALSRPGPSPEEDVKARIDGLVSFIRSIQKQ